jgi:hypothetical protein
MSTMRATAATNYGPANEAKPRRQGAPTAAVPALAGFGFVVIVAPVFYAMAISAAMMWEAQDLSWINNCLGGGIAWVVLIVAGVIYPSSRGKIWAIRIIRILSIPALLALLAAIIGDAVFYFKLPPAQSGFAIFLFWFALAPLLVAAGFLIDGLLHQPWFDPNATPEEIGPSRGTIGDVNRQAGMDATGRLSPEKLAAALAAPAPPPRWLCYAAPPIAAARMKGWWQLVISTPLCLAALAFVAFLPIRAIFVYALMGTFVGRLRVIQLYRKSIAETQQANLSPTIRKSGPSKACREPDPE